MGRPLDQSLRRVEFTRRWYRSFLRSIQSKGYRFRSFDDRLTEGDVVLRHDVDLSVDAAVEMARIEADLGIESTYFLLLTSPLYNVFESGTREQVEQLRALGHDVGVHFSTHAYWPGGDRPTDADLSRQVRREQSAFEAVVESPSSSVSFHMPPWWVLDRPFAGFQNTYEPALFSEIDYVADSSQRWRDEHPLDGGLGETVQLLTHPGLWGETDATFVERVQAAVAGSCRHSRSRTLAEFVGGDADV